MSEKERGFTVTDRRGSTPDSEAHPHDEPAADADQADAAEALEIDFGMFIMSLASSALVQLGELIPPGEDAPQTNLPLAKQTIDILGMLEGKTRGNLTSDEAQLLQHLLYDLRLKYLDAKKK